MGEREKIAKYFLLPFGGEGRVRGACEMKLSAFERDADAIV
jgi:hypothetical protein